MTARLAAPADLAALAALEAACFDHPWSVPSLAGELERGFALLVCEGETPRGYAVGSVVLDTCELLRIGAPPDARRRGVGAAALAAFLAEARRRGCAAAWLEVRADNAPALALYRAAGFQQTGRRPRYYPGGVDALLFSLDL